MATPDADRIFREVMTVEPPAAATPFQVATRDFVFGEVWSRPGLSRRDRRWITLTCVSAADAPEPIDAHVYAALKSGDIQLEEMLEFVLQFAVYCGWPKASHVEGVIRTQWFRIREERGEEPTPWPMLDNDTLGPNDWEERIAAGAKAFVDINLVPSPAPDTPYTHAGILSFVFGHVWQRPGLGLRDRRLITIPCVALDDAPMPLWSHVTSALHSGDITKEEMDELVLHFSAYYGFAKGEALGAMAETAWASKPA
ncbi:MAG: carboxymuconolactone decarboxylase family protein [Acidimicrobiia bacterium]|jgi:4-carboxymuconolactone decarboxylase